MTQEQGPERPDDLPVDEGQAGNADGPSPESSKGAQATEDKQRGPVSRLVRNKRFVKLVAVLITLALVYYAFFIVLPSEISWAEVESALKALTGAEIAALVVSGLILMVVLGWAAKASLPGLTLFQGFESSATSQMTAFVVPPPGDYVIRFAMYRTYGFSDEQSGASVLVSMVLRYVAIFFMPIIGLLAVIVAGTATSSQVWWFVGLTIAFVTVCWLMLRVIQSDAVAHSIGRRINSAVAWVMGLFHRTPAGDIERSVVSFGQRTRATVNTNGASLTASNATWALGNVVVLLMAMRFSGLELHDGPAGDGTPGLRFPDGGQHPADPRQERPRGTDPVHDHEPDQRCRPVGHDRCDPALPGGHLAAADAGGWRHVLRVALPGAP